MNKHKLACVVFMTAAIAGIVISCKDDTADTGPIDIVFPESNVSYGGYVEPLFLRGCAFSGCHLGNNAPHGLQLDSYQNAVSSDLGVIIPGDTANSRIIWAIEATHNKPRMPPDPWSTLTPNQKKGMRQWILEGAQNN